MNKIKKFKNTFKIITILSVGFFFTSLWGQACSSNGLLYNIEDGSLQEPQLLEFSAVSGTSGNGGTYEGKLTYLHLVPGFTCEGKVAPESLLRRDENKNWFFTKNLRDKCAEISMLPVSDVVFEGRSTLTYRDKIYKRDMAAPEIASGLPGYPVQFKVSAIISPHSVDSNPGDGICSNIDGMCSLQAAIDESSALDKIPVIILLENGTYKIQSPFYVKSHSLIYIKGEGPGKTILDGQGSSQIFINGLNGLFSSFGTLLLDGLTLFNGFTNVVFSGSAITNYQSLDISNCLFQKNNSLMSVVYAGVSSKDVYIRETRFDQNVGSGFQAFGPSSVTVENSSFTNNSGVGFYINNGTWNIRVRGSLFSQNKIGLSIRKCYVKCELDNNTIVDNQDYGLHLSGDDSVQLMLIRNSTIYRNGLGLLAGANLYFQNAGLAQTKLQVENTIIASGGSGKPNCSLSGNINGLVQIQNSLLGDIGDVTCPSTGLGMLIGSPQLLPLANNGGVTATLLPDLGSPAIDSGSNASCLPTDQRGDPRPKDKLGGGAICDMGAVEL